jgi:GT2 family glycosyltransferase
MGPEATPHPAGPIAREEVFAVVVNWNGGCSNLACIASLLADGIDADRIVFVDNGSRDGSLEAVQERHPGLRFVRNAQNLGFGEGANAGARLALQGGARAVFFVNNDVVLRPPVLQRLLAGLARHPGAGVVGPRVLYEHDPGTVWSAGGELTWRVNLTSLRGHGRRDAEPWRADRQVDYIAGCALLATREVLESVGLFDAALFAYMEDVDLCLRARSAGFGVRVLGEASVLHALSRSTGGGYSPRRKYMTGVNSVWFLRSHGRPLRWASFWLFDVLSLPLVFLAALPSGRGKAVLAKGKGILDGLRGRRVTAAAIVPGASRLW